jgi:hypothetical protein
VTVAYLTEKVKKQYLRYLVSNFTTIYDLFVVAHINQINFSLMHSEFPARRKELIKKYSEIESRWKKIKD